MEGTLKVSQENRCFLITSCGESRNFFRCPAAPKATQNMRVLNDALGIYYDTDDELAPFYFAIDFELFDRISDNATTPPL